MKIGIFAKTFSRPTIEELFQAIASYGIYSMQFNQKDILDEAFALLRDAIEIAHAKDRNKDFQACAAGKGILDFEYYLRCLKEIGFTGPLI